MDDNKNNNDEHRLILERRKKLDSLKNSGNNYSNNFSRDMSCSAIRDISMEENIIGDEEKNSH